MHRPDAWSDETRVDTLKALWAEGMSASRIAATMGLKSRNVVIGKVHRLGLEQRAPRGVNVKAAPKKADRVSKDWGELQRVRNALKAKKQEAVEMPKSVEDLRPKQLTPLAKLESNQCRFPYSWKADDPNNDGLPSGFCGRPVAHELCSWCGAHLLICTNPRPRQ